MKAKARTKARVKRPREYRATDTTLVNLRAVKARLLRLEDEVAILTSRVDAVAPPAPEPAG